jgi:hypothetical protein
MRIQMLLRWRRGELVANSLLSVRIARVSRQRRELRWRRMFHAVSCVLVTTADAFFQFS